MEAFTMKALLTAPTHLPTRPPGERQSVAETDLPAPQSVSQPPPPDIAGDSPPDRDDAEAAGQRDPVEARTPQARTRREYELDRETAELVFRTIDEQTGETVNQIPSEMILKLRAYARENGQSVENADQPADDPARTQRHIDTTA